LEGLAEGDALHPVQQAFIELSAAQCGYCLNGMIVASVALLRRNSDPTDQEIRAALKHHLCRCGTHIEILAAVRRAAMLSKKSPQEPETDDVPGVTHSAGIDENESGNDSQH
jgi:nicotinate dehydrogenase subunit A